MSPAFALALAAGPAYWLLLAALLQSPDPGVWVSRHAVAALMGVIVYPWLEEIVFRGWLQPALQRRLVERGMALAGSRVAAIVLTSLIFAALHGLRSLDAWRALSFFPSLVFGWFRDRHGSLWRSVVLHAWYNAGIAVLWGLG